MKHNVCIQPSGVKFSVTEDVSILESAINSNIYLEHSCRDGSCGACKAKLIRGKVNQPNNLEGLSDVDVKNGYILTCCSKAVSDIELDANYYPELAGIKQTVQPCKVEKLDFPSGDVAVLYLKMPPTANFVFLAGQYINLIIKGKRRSYSIANAMGTYNGIELHIRKVPNGLFSDFIFNDLKTNQLLRLEGPFGSFFVRKGDSPIIFLAGGTGFAPIKSMVEQLLKENTSREIYIYWGASTESGFYCGEAKKWQCQYENIRYIPVLSNKNVCDKRTGLVHEAVLEDINDLSKYEVYACGSKVMIEAARSDFISNGLIADKFYSDVFVSSE